MKVLFAIACVVVIAAGGYYLWDQLSAETCDDVETRLAAVQREYDERVGAIRTGSNLLDALNNAGENTDLGDELVRLTNAAADCL